VKCCNALNAATRKASASSKRDASNVLEIMLLPNVQGKQDLIMLNVFCAMVLKIILKIIKTLYQKTLFKNTILLNISYNTFRWQTTGDGGTAIGITD